MSLDKKRYFQSERDLPLTSRTVIDTTSTTDREVLTSTINGVYDYPPEVVISAIGRALLRSDSENSEELLLGLCDLALSVEDE